MNRLDRLRGKLEEKALDGLLVTSNYNRRYITGFTGTSGVAIISKNGAKFITDFRYVEQAESQVQGFDIVEHSGPIVDEIAKQVNELQISKLGFEQDHVTYSLFETYNKKIDTNLVPISGILEEMRLIKDEEELSIIREAVKIADAAFEHITKYIRPGVKEIDVSNELEFFMRKNGATASSFDTIVASGYRSALPHGVASEKEIEQGDRVTIDFGALYKGYCSDITRTVAVGSVSEDLKNIYKTVLEAQLKGVEGIKPGMTGKEADALTRDHITNKGYGKYFGHSTGHGLGMEVHEMPALSHRSDKVLQPGMVVTVEPGIYIPGLGGTRIEDDIVVTENGNDILSSSTKELLILGE